MTANMLKFSKMHGLGNDFVVIDTINQHYDELTVSQRQFIADRHRGIGCDQILLVESPTQQSVDFRYRIFNADGSEVSQCGNGARCFARFVREKGLTDKDEIVVETASGVITLALQNEGQTVTVNMGAPIWQPEQIPFQAIEQQQMYNIVLPTGDEVAIGAVSMGNPHAVMLVEDATTAKVEELGPIIEHHVRFPERVNVGFMQVIDNDQIKLRVYERGAGETQACGTGACAAAVVGMTLGLLNNNVNVALTGGVLNIRWDEGDNPVWMTGAATQVYDGEIAWATIAAQ